MNFFKFGEAFPESCFKVVNNTVSCESCEANLYFTRDLQEIRLHRSCSETKLPYSRSYASVSGIPDLGFRLGLVKNKDRSNCRTPDKMFDVTSLTTHEKIAYNKVMKYWRSSRCAKTQCGSCYKLANVDEPIPNKCFKTSPLRCCRECAIMVGFNLKDGTIFLERGCTYGKMNTTDIGYHPLNADIFMVSQVTVNKQHGNSGTLKDVLEGPHMTKN
ncbi:hypothetical protein HELRODRAFT_177425 [Helobdella robusta]|uniref:Uncharacterized protein n=1 Tax=Helobdella robusta TaxID=6412 RepID=T1FBP0_HELRO|nr:hypothetical protein HELRODRAFT_177425 [Helobdella robusta]ESN98179.1 hypothetical protein HELRODRAFT_177425 [Helobdella robusta]